MCWHFGYNLFKQKTAVSRIRSYSKNTEILQLPSVDKWRKKHKLSVIGKITVIKIFALPKWIYPLTVLSNPSEELINTIKITCLFFMGQ